MFISARGGFGQFLRQRTTFQHLNEKFNLETTQIIISELFEALLVAGLVEVTHEARSDEDVPGRTGTYILGSDEVYSPITG